MTKLVYDRPVIDQVFDVLTSSSSQWMNTKEVEDALKGVRQGVVSQCMTALRKEGSIQSRPAGVHNLMEHRAKRVNRPEHRRQPNRSSFVVHKGGKPPHRDGRVHKEVEDAIKSVSQEVRKDFVGTDALDQLLTAAAALEREVRELRAYKDKTAAALKALALGKV